MARFVGVLVEKQGRTLVQLRQKGLSYEIRIPGSLLHGAPLGNLVAVLVPDEQVERALARVEGREQYAPLSLQGEVERVLGNPEFSDVQMQGIIEAHGLATDFLPEELAAAEKVPQTLSEAYIQRCLKAGRRDLRRLRTLTIDGKDAKDLDDAISIRRQKDGSYRLWVHIADVSHYVTEGSVLDQAALSRGNSTYLADRVLPMLPVQLSNGICSLHPEVDRLCLSAELDFDAEGRRLGGRVYPSVIRSDLRANYQDVQTLIYEGGKVPEYRSFKHMLQKMADLAALLRARRRERGFLDFSLPETKLQLDAEGQVQDIRPYPQQEAQQIIEEFMIAANVFVAEHFGPLCPAFIYRVHEKPDLEKIERFAQAARQVGLSYKLRELSEIQSLARAAREIQDSEAADLLQQLLLRSMAKARYDRRCLGHFALDEDHYCHFTSPIRRYADLFIHRMIHYQLAGKKSGAGRQAKAQAAAERCSICERESMAAEYESVELKMAEYMEGRVGEAYVGQIVGLIASGAFVRLENTVEGFLPFRLLEDHFVYNEQELRALGLRSGQELAVGQFIQLELAAVSVPRRHIDFRPQLPLRVWRGGYALPPDMLNGTGGSSRASGHATIVFPQRETRGQRRHQRRLEAARLALEEARQARQTAEEARYRAQVALEAAGLSWSERLLEEPLDWDGEEQVQNQARRQRAQSRVQNGRRQAPGPKGLRRQKASRSRKKRASRRR